MVNFQSLSLIATSWLCVFNLNLISVESAPPDLLAVVSSKLPTVDTHLIEPSKAVKLDDQFDLPRLNSSEAEFENAFENATFSKTFRIAVITDLDDKSVLNSSTDAHGSLWWVSYLKEGTLTLNRNDLDSTATNISVKWDEAAPYAIKSGLAYSGRGMELSTLTMFNGKLLACDDRTGVIYELVRTSSEIVPRPWVILADGVNTTRGSFKCEWATEKGGDLYVGGHGLGQVIQDNKLVNKSSKYVKQITPWGEVTTLDWTQYFDAVAKTLGVYSNGYVVNEAMGWSDKLQKWMLMPRYVSNLTLNATTVSYAGSDVILLMDDQFQNVTVKHIGNVVATHGFSAFKWIPGTNDEIVVALKSMEVGDEQETFIMAFDSNGNILLPETSIGKQKFEGIEFLS